jgi:multiple sugar transport system substrate-binding protein
MHTSVVRWLATGAAVLAASIGIAACGSSSGTGSTGNTYTVWDPYPQFDDNSAWVKLLQSCASKAGVTIKRTGFDTSDLTNKALLAAQQSNSPDVLVVDNPVVSTLAEAGALTTTDDTKVDTSGVARNLLAAGQLDGKTYGTPIGANTLALFYNKAILQAAGVDPNSITDWASLTTALGKVAGSGKKGITFSAIGTEEGSFQFLPWFWGAHAQLTQLGSAQGIAALSLWSNWLKSGYAPNSVLNNTQTTSWQEFAAGQFAFAENGTWQLANVAKLGFGYGLIPIPAQNGGAAPVPTGGEFITVPVQHDTSRYQTDQKLVTCLSSPGNIQATDGTLSYVGPSSAVQEKQVATDPTLKVWVDAVHAAKGRTSDNLGTKYPKISEQLWTAVQGALSGAKTPDAAMSAAQAAAGQPG